MLKKIKQAGVQKAAALDLGAAFVDVTECWDDLIQLTSLKKLSGRIMGLRAFDFPGLERFQDLEELNLEASFYEGLDLHRLLQLPKLTALRIEHPYKTAGLDELSPRRDCGSLKFRIYPSAISHVSTNVRCCVCHTN